MVSPNISNKHIIPEIVFFDLETTVPIKTGQKFRVLEFGAIIVCPRKLIELESYCTVIRPHDMSCVPVRSRRLEGLTREAIANAPLFDEVADKIFDVLDGRIWAGHNIRRFDCVRIKEAFARINRPAPTPAGIIDSLGVLTEKFGRRAGNMKMATLADYFGLGQQKHRELGGCKNEFGSVKALCNCTSAGIKPAPKCVEWARAQQLKCNHKKQKLTGQSDNLSNKTSAIRGNSTSRKSPPSASHRRAVPYARDSLGKMTDRVKSMFSYARSQPLNNFLKHSKLLLR
ncbi:hypothetical protein OROGR_017315 [Orobanche gracilis]